MMNRKRRSGEPLWEPRTSQFRGVQWDRNGGRWRARIHKDRTRHIGYYETEEEAAMAWDLAMLRHYGENDGKRKLNFGEKSLEVFRQEELLAQTSNAQPQRNVRMRDSRNNHGVPNDEQTGKVKAEAFPATEGAAPALDCSMIREQGEVPLANFPLCNSIAGKGLCRLEMQEQQQQQQQQQATVSQSNGLRVDQVSTQKSTGIRVEGGVSSLPDGKFGVQLSVDLGTFVSYKDAEAWYCTVLRLLVGLNGLQPDHLLTKILEDHSRAQSINEHVLGIKQTDDQSYVAELDVDGKLYQLGPFPAVEDACKANERFSFLLSGIQAWRSSPNMFWSRWGTPAELEALVMAVKAARGMHAADNRETGVPNSDLLFGNGQGIVGINSNNFPQWRPLSRPVQEPLQSQRLAFAMQRICQPSLVSSNYIVPRFNISRLDGSGGLGSFNTSAMHTPITATRAAEAAMAAATELKAQLAATKHSQSVIKMVELNFNRLTNASGQQDEGMKGSHSYANAI